MGELLHHFGVDGRLLAAQAVNFGVLLFILWKFAYRPILDMLRERREGIERGLAMTRDAEKRMADITSLQERKLEEARREAVAIVAKAEETATAHRAEMLAAAEKKGNAMIGEARRVIGEEKAKLREELAREARELVRDGIAQILMKMPPRPRDRELIDAAISAMNKQ